MKLKNILVFAIGILLAFSSVNPAFSKELTAKKINDKLLVTILNSSSTEELNLQNKDIEKQVALRLVKIPVSGSCIPETEGVCGYDYYLAVSEYDEDPAQAIYLLGHLGEITNVTWLPGAKRDQALLQWTVTKYPAQAVTANRLLKQETNRYSITASVHSVSVQKIK